LTDSPALPIICLHGAYVAAEVGRMSKRKSITEDAVRRATPGFLRDDKLVGFGVRVTPNGAKSFIVEARVNGRMRRYAIGPASRFTVDEARGKARTLLAEMHEGEDPQLKRKAARQRSDTLQAMLDGYIEAKGVRETTAAKYQAQMRRHLIDWLDKPIADITPREVRFRYEKILKRSVSEANGTMRALRAVCRRAITILPDKADGSPAMTAAPTSSLMGSWRALERRTSLLEADELPAWWGAVAAIQSDASRKALQSLLITGLRVNELLRLTWADVDLAHAKLTIKDSKTGAFAKFVGAELTRWLSQWRGGAKDEERVFGVDDLRAALEIVAKHGGKRITPHDLRRTYLTFGERVGTPMDILKRLANHSTRGDVTAGYVCPSDNDLRHWAGVIEGAILKAAQGFEPARLRVVA
jgi:integrase